MRTQHIGPEELIVGVKVQLRSDLSFAEIAEAINRIEDRVRTRVPAARLLYIEPDVATTAPSEGVAPLHPGEQG
jgi:hypothetical protein